MSDFRRILGAEGDDIGCDACFGKLDRYVELELAGADAESEIHGMRAHLESCPGCAEEHESLLELAR